MDTDKKYQEILQKFEQNKDNKLDLSMDEDLSIAIMNLVSIEEHFFFTGAKLGKPEYFDLLQEARKMRGDLLRKIVKDPEGEQWCISKHLLGATMRLMEVGTKLHKADKKDEAGDFFKKAYDLYSLFWGINLKVIDMAEVKKIDNDQLDVHDKESGGLMGKLNKLVKKVIDCCIE